MEDNGRRYDRENIHEENKAISTIKSYTDNKIIKYKVTVGRRTYKDFKTPLEAAQKGIALAIEDWPSVIHFLEGKPIDRQVGIIFGAEIRDKYFR